jgi:hypothetical protein
MYGRMYGWMYGQMYRRMYGWMYGRKYGQMYGQMYRQMYGRMYECTNVWDRLPPEDFIGHWLFGVVQSLKYQIRPVAGWGLATRNRGP